MLSSCNNIEDGHIDRVRYNCADFPFQKQMCNLTMLLKVTTNGSQMLEDVDNREEKHFTETIYRPLVFIRFPTVL